MSSEDIVAWIRKRPCIFGYRDMNALADRIEEAARREMSKIASKDGADFGQLGNAAKMREALILVQKKINYLIGSLTVPNSLVANRMEINGIINAALSAPPRNCDVGTAEEQMKRQHDTMCNTTKACPDSDWSCRKCFAEWAQMPYEEGGAK